MYSAILEVLQWKAEKVRTPAKRGRKPGTGKKNMIKGVTGKIILVTVDLSKFENGDVFFQVGLVVHCKCMYHTGNHPVPYPVNKMIAVPCGHTVIRFILLFYSLTYIIHSFFLSFLVQKGFCQAYKGISKCLECNAVGAGEFPASRYCRFLEFRK